MHITIRDYINRGYLIVSQELQLKCIFSTKHVLLYIDASTVSCLYNDRILQYETFEQLVAPLGLIGLHTSILTKIYTHDDRNVYQIRQRYIKDFMIKFHIIGSSSAGNKITFTLSTECMHNISLKILRQEILSYNNSIKNFEFAIQNE